MWRTGRALGPQRSTHPSRSWPRASPSSLSCSAAFMTSSSPSCPRDPKLCAVRALDAWLAVRLSLKAAVSLQALLRKAASRQHLLGRRRAYRAAREGDEVRRSPLACTRSLGARAKGRVADPAARLLCEATARSGTAAPPTASAAATAGAGAVVAPDHRRIMGHDDERGVNGHSWQRARVRITENRPAARRPRHRRSSGRAASRGSRSPRPHPHRGRAAPRSVLPARRRAAVFRLGGDRAAACDDPHRCHRKQTLSAHRANPSALNRSSGLRGARASERFFQPRDEAIGPKGDASRLAG